MSNLTVLFAPGSGNGAVKTSRSIAEELGRRGHRIVFAVNEKFKGQLERYGFEEVLYSEHELEQQSDSELWTQFVWKNSEAMKGNPIEIIDGFVVKKFERQLAQNKALDKHYRSIIAVIKPDLIIVDGFVCSPALTNSGIPWVYLYSGAPLNMLNNLTLPPPFSGFQIRGGNTNKWTDFRQEFNEKISSVWSELNNWCLSVGAPELEPHRLHPYSPFLNIYILPKELNYYSNKSHLPPNWMQVDCLCVEEEECKDQEFKLPEHMLNSDKKLILVNMGTLGTSDYELMRKLVANLSRSEHMFIIVTGAHHGKYQLSDNMWGIPSVPLAKVLPYVDLLIHSGSNYTVCEALLSGKPMIVLPLYGDQFENAQRVKELNFGLQLCPYTCTVTSLIASMEALLVDPNVIRRAKLISYRLKKSSDKQNAVNRIENIANQ